MKKSVLFLLSMIAAFFMQAQSSVDSLSTKELRHEGLKKHAKKPDTLALDSIKIAFDGMVHKFEKRERPDSLKPIEVKDSLPVIKPHRHNDSLKEAVADSLKAKHKHDSVRFTKRDSLKLIEHDSLKIAKLDSLFGKKHRKVCDSLHKLDSLSATGKGKHRFDSLFVVRPIDSAAKDSTIAHRKSHKETTHLYPNPAPGAVTIQADSTVAKIEVLNATTGTVVYQSQNVSSFDLTEVPSGVYIIKIQIGDEVITKTVTKP